jgi:hypothetical protein
MKALHAGMKLLRGRLKTVRDGMNVLAGELKMACGERERPQGCGRYVSRRCSTTDERRTTTAREPARPSTVVRLSSYV